jgi:hypothetical protein
MPGTNNLQKLDELAARLQEDITLAKSREEHIRLTARANEARQISNDMKTELDIPLYDFDTVTFTSGVPSDDLEIKTASEAS